MTDSQALKGKATVVLTGPDGAVKSTETIHNVITDAGDLYYATRGAAGVLPANGSDVAAKVTGMKLGTDSTPEAKTGAGAAIVSYVSGSGQAFDASFPTVTSQGAGAGVNIGYKVTYAAGTATANGISEATIVNDATTNNTDGSSAANTIGRIVFTAVNKTAADVLTITWDHTFDGQ